MIKELIQRNRKAVIQRNTLLMKVVLMGAILVFAMSFVSCFILESYHGLQMAYGAGILMCLVLFWVVSCTRAADHATFFYVALFMMAFYCIYTNAFLWPDDIAIAILAVLFVFPTLFIDVTWRINLATILVAVVYLIATSIFKSPVLLSNEIVSVMEFTVQGCMIGTFMRRIQLSNFDMMEKLRMSEEQYRLVLNHSGSMMCRYDVVEMSITMPPETAARFDLPEKVDNAPYGAVADGRIAPESIEEYMRFYGEIIHGNREGTMVIHRKMAIGWRWLKARYTTIFSSDGKPKCAVISFVDITEQRQKEMEEKVRLETDGLTGALNRVTFVEKFQRTLESKENRRHAMLLLDIDYFKTINDTLGHQGGDYVLQQLTDELHRTLRKQDAVGRVGGDEFMILLEDIEPQVVEKRAASLCRLLYHRLEKDVQVSVSMGVALYPRDGQTFEDLYQRADIALYKAKELGRNRCMVYDGSMQEGEYAPRPTPIDL